MTARSRPRVAFLGTPALAIPTLDRLHDLADVRLIVTQPDRPVGRSKTPQPPPVKRRAVELGIPVAQPERSRETAGILEAAGPLDVAVLVAFGQLIRSDALSVPLRGFLNVHFSVLPRWRGAAPVQRAIMAGDRRVGVTVMVLDEGLDTGPTVATRSTALGRGESGGDVLDRLAVDGADLLARILDPYVSGRMAPTPQPDGATLAPKLTPQDRMIDWSEPADRTVDRIRALAPRPGATAMFQGAPVKILAAEAADEELRPGELTEGALVGAGDGAVRLVTVQPAGKQAMSAADWMRGIRGEDLRFDLAEGH